jgi:hypothetical protein
MSTASTGKPSALIKPTLDTRFHIDYDWWERQPAEDLRIYLLSHLPIEQRERLSQVHEDREVDYIDPETGEVSRVDELRLALRQAAEDPDFINKDLSIVDNVFRVFLKNNNTPTSARELESIVGTSARTILQLLSGRTIYKGIRPFTG